LIAGVCGTLAVRGCRQADAGDGAPASNLGGAVQLVEQLFGDPPDQVLAKFVISVSS